MNVFHSIVLEYGCAVIAGGSCFPTAGSAYELKHMDSELALQQFPVVFITKTVQLQR